VASAENNHVIFCFYFHSKEWNQRNSKSQYQRSGKVKWLMPNSVRG
jgi:5-methylcytosine-specific restriction endonuclease McrA